MTSDDCLLNSLPRPGLSVDWDGVVQAANQRCADVLLGPAADSAQLCGQSALSFLYGISHRAQARDILSRIEKRRPHEPKQLVCLLNCRAQPVPMSVNLQPLAETVCSSRGLLVLLEPLCLLQLLDAMQVRERSAPREQLLDRLPRADGDEHPTAVASPACVSSARVSERS